MKKIFIKGLNTCVQRRQNLEKYRRFAQSHGYELTVQLGGADEVWLWTCGFRSDAKENTFAYIRSMAAFGGLVIVGGCLPDIAIEELEDCCNKYLKNYRIMPWKKEAEILADGEQLESFNDVFCEPAVCDNVDEYKRLHPDMSLTFADQFQKLVVAYGCNCDCVYCSEHLAFPAYHSFAPKVLIDRCRQQLQDSGRYKVMLIADSLGEYGCDLPNNVTLMTLIRQICDLDKRVTVALNNFNPQFSLKFMLELRGFIKEGRIAHINLPIQSACTAVLQRMRRHYTKDDLASIMKMFHELDFRAYDTHIIVGFDGETEAEFRETIDFICEHKMRYVLASAYMDMSHGKAGQSITSEEKAKRLAYAQEHCREAGIIINCDNGTVAADRLQRVAKGA